MKTRTRAITRVAAGAALVAAMALMISAPAFAAPNTDPANPGGGGSVSLPTNPPPTIPPSKCQRLGTCPADHPDVLSPDEGGTGTTPPTAAPTTTAPGTGTGTGGTGTGTGGNGNGNGNGNGTKANGGGGDGSGDGSGDSTSVSTPADASKSKSQSESSDSDSSFPVVAVVIGVLVLGAAGAGGYVLWRRRSEAAV